MEKTSQADVLIGVATVLVTLMGLWLAHNYRRQMKVKLSQTRLEAYSRLWEITGIAAPTRLDGWGDDGYLQLYERRDLWAAMTDWYYGKGGGMFLTDITKEVYLNVKHNLVCESSSALRPDGLYKEVRTALGLPRNQEFDDKVRGTLAIRLISLLRTQLKSDLTIYGSTYSGKLAEYERYFLEASGVRLYSKAWSTANGRGSWPLWLLRLRAVVGRPKEKSQVPKEGRPKLSPLLEIPTILSVGRTPRTPPSSRTAVTNALRGIHVDQYGDNNRTNQIPPPIRGRI